MLDNIIDKNIMFLQNHGVKINNGDDRAVYKYGLQILYYYVIDLIGIFSLAYLFGRLYETAIMTFIFGLLQVFGGGYHAKTPLRCLLTMIIGAATGNFLIILLADKLVFNIILTVVFSGIIFISDPVINKNRPVSKKIKHRSKLVVKTVVILILVSVFALSYFNKNIEVAAIAVILGLYLSSLITAKRKNKGEENKKS
jgi:accessory gene regulator B